MAESVVHRGPDAGGFFYDANATLAHRRLKIIDLEGGRQPLYNEDRSALVVFNGEIYNYRDLTKELISYGHRFQTRSDTETIIHAYEQFGDSCVDHFRGMFAFAIWDRNRRRLLLARDRLGVKPLYYYQQKGMLAFASEIKSLLELPEVPREVDPVSLDLFLSVGYVPGPRTMLRHVFKVPPGHVLVWDENGLKIRKYWDIEYDQSVVRPESTYQEQFEQLLDESVRLRLISEVPLGVFLSGGLDSSSILATASKWSPGERIKTFSVGCDLPPEEAAAVNEFHYARLAANAFSTDHHEFQLNSDDFRDFIPKLLWFLDEPITESSCIPLYFISRLARNYITVVLSGEGADEIFGGYEIYRKMLAIEALRTQLRPIGMMARSIGGRSANPKVRAYAEMVDLPLELRYRSVSLSFRENSKRRLLGLNGESGKNIDSVFGQHFERVKDASPLNRMLYIDAKTWLADSLLLKADKMTMANSLELRVPFLDHVLVEFAAKLPDQQKLQWTSTKAILRKHMRRTLPHQIITRTKKGFPVPLHYWLRNDLREFVRESILSRDSACPMYMDRRELEQIVSGNGGGKAAPPQEIWTLLVFEFWNRLFAKQTTTEVRQLAMRAG
jgi:asparagine synthase (glutamine-hydrolysing)